jgi:hypothetical protein
MYNIVVLIIFKLLKQKVRFTFSNFASIFRTCHEHDEKSEIILNAGIPSPCRRI